MEREKTRQFSIDQPTTDDVEGLHEMHIQSWFDTYPNEAQGISREYIAECVKKFNVQRRVEIIEDSVKNPNHYMRVVHDENGTVIGFSDSEIEDGTYELKGLYVDKPMQGTGLAKELMEDALEWLGTDHEIFLIVVAYNIRAQKFYKKYGFEIVTGSDTFYDNEPLPVIKMVRKEDKA